MTTQTITVSRSAAAVALIFSAGVTALAGVAVLIGVALILSNNVSFGSTDPALYIVPGSFAIFAVSSLSVAARLARGEAQARRPALLTAVVYAVVSAVAVGTSLLAGDTFSAALATAPGIVAASIAIPLLVTAGEPA
jgi:hypothetical protein